MHAIVIAPLIAATYYRVYTANQPDLVTVFTVAIAVLVFFTLLMRFALTKKTSANTELNARTLTFWWMLVFFLISAATSSIVFTGLLTMVSLAAFYEYLCFDATRRNAVSRVTNTLCGLVIPVAFTLNYLGHERLAIYAALLFLMLALPVMLVLENATNEPLKRFGHLSSGILFFSTALSLAVPLHQHSAMVLLLCVYLTEFRDMCAYWMGKYMQRQLVVQPNSGLVAWLNRPVANQINASKSWGVGLMSSVVLAALALAFTGLINRSLELPVTPWFIVLWGLIISFLGLIGDLVFSMLKRDFAIKDSGSLLPGNTGIIDRIDALIFTVPATYLLFRYVA